MEKMNVDVVVCTYNSESYLSLCLESIRRNVPFNRIIIVDKHSTDRTLEIAKKYGAEIHFMDGGLAEARKTSFELVSTDIFVNVDSDVILADNWFDNMMSFWKQNTVCLWGVTIDQHPPHNAYTKTMHHFRDPTKYNIPHLLNMIARKDILKDIKFPSCMMNISMANEDLAIKKWIERKGFKCITVPVFSKHFSYPKPLWVGASSRFTGYTSIHSILLRLILSIPQAILAGFYSKNPLVIPYWINFRFSVLYGFLYPHKYYDFKR